MKNDTQTTNTSRPSKKQKELLGFIDNFIAGHGYGPSYREVMRALDYKSVSTVAVHVDNLIAKGHLRKRDKSARSLEVLTVVAPSRVETQKVTRAEEKWLVDAIEGRFKEYDEAPSDKKRDDLFVLVGALHVLGLEAAESAFKSRLPRS
jgi:repressor LexA